MLIYLFSSNYGCFRSDTCNFFLCFGNIFFDYVDFDVGMKKARQK
jgi:hypothetical protein